jgi:hypothetical protein
MRSSWADPADTRSEASSLSPSGDQIRWSRDSTTACSLLRTTAIVGAPIVKVIA